MPREEELLRGVLITTFLKYHRAENNCGILSCESIIEKCLQWNMQATNYKVDFQVKTPLVWSHPTIRHTNDFEEIIDIINEDSLIAAIPSKSDPAVLKFIKSKDVTLADISQFRRRLYEERTDELCHQAMLDFLDWNRIHVSDDTKVDFAIRTPERWFHAEIDGTDDEWRVLERYNFMFTASPTLVDPEMEELRRKINPEYGQEDNYNEQMICHLPINRNRERRKESPLTLESEIEFKQEEQSNDNDEELDTDSNQEPSNRKNETKMTNLPLSNVEHSHILFAPAIDTPRLSSAQLKQRRQTMDAGDDVVQQHNESYEDITKLNKSPKDYSVELNMSPKLTKKSTKTQPLKARILGLSFLPEIKHQNQEAPNQTEERRHNAFSSETSFKLPAIHTNTQKKEQCQSRSTQIYGAPYPRKNHAVEVNKLPHIKAQSEFEHKSNKHETGEHEKANKMWKRLKHISDDQQRVQIQLNAHVRKPFDSVRRQCDMPKPKMPVPPKTPKPLAPIRTVKSLAARRMVTPVKIRSDPKLGALSPPLSPDQSSNMESRLHRKSPSMEDDFRSSSASPELFPRFPPLCKYRND